jgi:FKBP-type peptidyl-prolyl cis-trans isomerase FklB
LEYFEKTMHTYTRTLLCFAVAGLASAANPEPEGGQKVVTSWQWQDWITPKVGLVVLYMLYQLYSTLGRGETKKFSETFLAENALKEGVVTLASGLQYKVLRAGEGDSHPLPDSPCDCHYEGRCAKDFPTGKKFDSSYFRGSPTTFAPNQVIKGWTEAMQLMVEGDKWEMYIPSNLAYGDTGRVPGCLVFTMEILAINGGSVLKATKKDD